MIKSEVDFLEMVYFVTLALQKSASMIDLLHKLGFKSIFHLAKSVQFADCPVVLQEDHICITKTEATEPKCGLLSRIQSNTKRKQKSPIYCWSSFVSTGDRGSSDMLMVTFPKRHLDTSRRHL